jgi:hypothetical protein
LSKVCSQCGETKDLSEFQFQKSRGSHRANCKDCQAIAYKRWAENNKDKIRSKKKEYYHSNPDFRRKHKEINLKNQPRYSAKRAANEAKRRFGKNCATPPWLSDDHLSEIENLYWLARDLKAVSGQDYHVDHIIPLKGKNVCGLHVPWNLQILPSDVNIRKSNKTP